MLIPPISDELLPVPSRIRWCWLQCRRNYHLHGMSRLISLMNSPGPRLHQRAWVFLLPSCCYYGFNMFCQSQPQCNFHFISRGLLHQDTTSNRISDRPSKNLTFVWVPNNGIGKMIDYYCMVLYAPWWEMENQSGSRRVLYPYNLSCSWYNCIREACARSCYLKCLPTSSTCRLHY